MARLALIVYCDEKDRSDIAYALTGLRDQGRNIWWTEDEERTESANQEERRG